MIKGMDYLGMGNPHWPLNKTIQVTPEGTAIGVFDTTFGPVLPKLRKMLDTGKYPAVRIHLWWSNDHKICKKRLIKKRAPLYEQLAQDYPNVQVYLSHSCEHFETKVKKVRRRIKLLRKYAPSCIAVNAPDGPGVMVGNCVNELHEHYSGKIDADKPCIASTDGADVSDTDVTKFLNGNNHCRIVFLWSYRFNLREIGENKSVPPKERTNAPSKGELKAIVNLIK